MTEIKSYLNNIIVIPALAVTLLINSCTYFTTSPLDIPEKQEEELFWPLPPDKPRIKYIKSIYSEEDVVKRTTKTFWHKLLEIITGFIFGEEGDTRIMRPYGIAEYDGMVYVADQQLAVVHIFDFKSNQYFQIGRSMSGSLISPICVAVDDNGNMYVSDSIRRRVFVYNIDRINIMELGGDGVFSRPTGLAVNSKEKLLYVADTVANNIKVFDLNGNFKFEFGKRGSKKDEELNLPTNIFLDREGYIYICDSMNFKLKIFDKDGNFISKFGKIGDRLGYFARPKGVAVDSDGHIYVVESLFDRVQIFDRNGVLLLVFGKSGRNRGEFWLPSGIFVDSRDRVYIADAYNSRVQIFQYIKKDKT